jgi:hypothetical protein
VNRAVGVAAVTAAVLAGTARARFRNWGATPEEVVGVHPGDQLLPGPVSTTTYGVSVDAPAEDVWPWLVQMGQGRGGMYSYEWLENLFGLEIVNADEIRQQWQRLAVGDQVRVVPPGKLGMPEGYAFRVALVDAPRAIVLRQQPPEHPWNATWAFLVVPDGPARCRLLARSRSARVPGAAGVAARVAEEVMRPVILLMTRRMLLGIKERAERRAGSTRSTVPPSEDPASVGDNATALGGPEAYVDLYWLPLGAGGHFVKWNGRIFEALAARIQHREATDLYHCALEVRMAGDRHVIEQGPVWNLKLPGRGVVAEGAVGLPWLGRFGLFRYEVRCWRGGKIPDAAMAIDSPQRLSTDVAQARLVLDLVPVVPTPTWGRDELHAGEMWNSNSVISWLLARSGIDTTTIAPPLHGSAPGWRAGLIVAADRRGTEEASEWPLCRGNGPWKAARSWSPGEPAASGTP